MDGRWEMWLWTVVGDSGWGRWLGIMVGYGGWWRWLGTVVRYGGWEGWLGSVVKDGRFFIVVWAKDRYRDYWTHIEGQNLILNIL